MMMKTKKAKKAKKVEIDPLMGLMPTENVRLAYDCVLMKPACVLIAVALGADSRVPHLFPIGSWLLSPTPNMEVYDTSPEQLLAVIAKTEQAMVARK